jgi:hypothetical protein
VRVRRSVWIIACVLAASAPLGWVGSDVLESQNWFCTSCHLDADTPLHAAKWRDFTTVPPVNLASAHFAKNAEFRCIDCHRGASAANRLRVKLLSARDAVMYLAGRFDEPKQMKHPLWREDCTKCHAEYHTARSEDFHAIEVHNLPNFALNCVKCHEAHPTGRTAERAFLAREPLLAQCRNCHEEF